MRGGCTRAHTETLAGALEDFPFKELASASEFHLTILLLERSVRENILVEECLGRGGSMLWLSPEIPPFAEFEAGFRPNYNDLERSNYTQINVHRDYLKGGKVVVCAGIHRG